MLTGATGACGLWILQAGQGRSPASGKTVYGNRTVYPPVARCLPGLRERAIFGFCSPDRGAVPPPGRWPAAIAPFIPWWRATYRGYGSVRSLDFVARTGTQSRLREDGLRQSHRLSPGGALLTGLRERAVFGFCRPDRDAVPPPEDGLRQSHPFIPRWRVTYRGYGSVRSLDFVARTGAQPRLRERPCGTQTRA
ncbi:Uncharacterised protein [Raoultella planticola]|uniref:Uncharacterized protein n=1 Tax=Raoultella planticola TaxID=575 RepID=A0A485B8I3_RAOPL|nr:Uncharacterised protein [Raoultella planticola]